MAQETQTGALYQHRGGGAARHLPAHLSDTRQLSPVTPACSSAWYSAAEPRDPCLLICLILASWAPRHLPAHLPNTRMLFPSPRDPPHLGVEPGSPRLQADSLPSKPPGKPLRARRLPNPSPCRLPRWTFKDTDLIVLVPREDQEPQWGHARFFVIFSSALTSLVTAHSRSVLKSIPHVPSPSSDWDTPLSQMLHGSSDYFSRAFPVTSENKSPKAGHNALLYCLEL